MKRALSEARVAELRGALRELQEKAFSLATRSLEYEYEVPVGTRHQQLRQLLSAADFHPSLWAHASRPPLTNLVADVIAPNVKFKQSNVVLK